ncbi:hypothetical protein [Anabaena azotica]|uniref:Uncharacterized protein n=1 Tax=Anabaena azotica FACHB-119 TaxID=947527 RepID=A0ABR8D2I6_9NOST|nr:hypothetical protein [Anabaena azotica]MBD2500929.1 hypothetical protein [Anabaena azotica FACHB-119]
MGKSKSIQQQIEADKKNQQFIDQITANLQKTLAGAEADLQTRINDFYTSGRNWKHAQYVFGAQQSYEVHDTWGLDNLTNLINSIVTAVVSTVTGSLPEGTEASDEVPEINQAAGIDDNLQLLIATNTANIFTGLLNSFGAVNRVQSNRATRLSPLGQGLRLFTTVGIDVQQSASFLNNRFVIGYYYLYRVEYSHDEFNQQAEQTVAGQYQITLELLNMASEEIFQQYINRQITLQQYLKSAQFIEDATKDVIAKIAELNKNNRQDTIQLMEGQLARLIGLQINYGYDKDVDAFISPFIAEAKQKIKAKES